MLKIKIINTKKQTTNNLKEIYGKLPESVNNLMLVALTKNMAQKFFITNILIKISS